MDQKSREWHLNNRMPKNLTLEQRIVWHREHAKHCSCRPMPENIAKLLKEEK